MGSDETRRARTRSLERLWTRFEEREPRRRQKRLLSLSLSLSLSLADAVGGSNEIRRGTAPPRPTRPPKTSLFLSQEHPLSLSLSLSLSRLVLEKHSGPLERESARVLREKTRQTTYYRSARLVLAHEHRRAGLCFLTCTNSSWRPSVSSRERRARIESDGRVRKLA